MEKQSIVLMVLLIALIISGIINIVLFINIDFSPPQSEEPPDFIIGTSSGPHTLELVDSWDKHSNDILYQVVETLFSYDLYDLDLPRINKLAYSYWWENSTILQIRLREGIIFHDGTPFNAEAAKWNLDRLQYLINATGTNPGQVAHTQSLWMFPDGDRFIMNCTTTLGEFNITITLNGPYGPFLNTLAYINAGMISPTAHATDEKSFIDLTNGDVVGTGPFIFDRYKPNVDVTLSRWDKYWRKPANFNKIVFAILPDATSQNNAFLSYTVDILIDVYPSFIPYYENDSHLTVKHFTDDTGIPGLQYHYLGFNNKKYNATWRKVFSYAINYTYIIEELQGGNVIRANSPISPAFGNSHNISSQGADYNLTKAREVMQSMGFGVGYTTDQEWIDHAQSIGEKTPFLTLTYQYNAGGSFREGMFIAVNNWFKLIGLNVAEDACTWGNFLNYLIDDHDHLGLFAIGWSPDDFDPFNMLDPLINPNSSWNSAQVNDTTLNAMMNLALETMNDAARNDIYKDIQGYFSEVGYFHAPLYHPKITYVHGANIYGVPYNAMQRFEAYGIYRSLYPM
jgi:peptide/nickel transport system substrate-binding protein